MMLPKAKPIRSKKLRRSANGEQCTMFSPWCNGNSATTVWCHSNMGMHGKGRGRKADDLFGFYGCSGCNAWYDSSEASREEKAAYFFPAHARSLLLLCDKGLLIVK